MKSDGRRVLRVEKSLREVISSYLISGFREPLPAMVSIPQVRATKDLRNAKVYVSLIGADESEETQNECISILNESAFEIQGHVGKQLKMKFCPKLKFYRDELQQEALRVEKTIREISQSQNEKE